MQSHCWKKAFPSIHLLSLSLSQTIGILTFFFFFFVSLVSDLWTSNDSKLSRGKKKNNNSKITQGSMDMLAPGFNLQAPRRDTRSQVGAKREGEEYLNNRVGSWCSRTQPTPIYQCLVAALWDIELSFNISWDTAERPAQVHRDGTKASARRCLWSWRQSLSRADCIKARWANHLKRLKN